MSTKFLLVAVIFAAIVNYCDSTGAHAEVAIGVLGGPLLQGEVGADGVDALGVTLAAHVAYLTHGSFGMRAELMWMSFDVGRDETAKICRPATSVPKPFRKVAPGGTPVSGFWGVGISGLLMDQFSSGCKTYLIAGVGVCQVYDENLNGKLKNAVVFGPGFGVGAGQDALSISVELSFKVVATASAATIVAPLGIVVWF